ncbi:DUF1853 family protein [Marinomonas sp.]
MTITGLQHPYVKDLAWLIAGFYIEQDCNLANYWHHDVEAKLQALEDDPVPLIEAINACKSHFLGSYFETLFSFAIKHFSSLGIVKEHFQIQQEGKTLGEVDALLRDPQGRLLQCEIAVKFYLQRPDLAPHDWIGPNKQDSLAKKVARARQHQLTLLKSPAGRQAVDLILGSENEPIADQLLIFGRLFFDLNLAKNWQEKCAENPVQQELCGWLKLENLALLGERYEYAKLMSKPHWLALPEFTQGIAMSELSNFLRDKFLLDDRPINLCCWSEKSNQIPANIFVVPNDW